MYHRIKNTIIYFYFLQQREWYNYLYIKKIDGLLKFKKYKFPKTFQKKKKVSILFQELIQPLVRSNKKIHFTLLYHGLLILLPKSR